MSRYGPDSISSGHPIRKDPTLRLVMEVARRHFADYSAFALAKIPLHPTICAIALARSFLKDGLARRLSSMAKYGLFYGRLGDAETSFRPAALSTTPFRRSAMSPEWLRSSRHLLVPAWAIPQS